LTVIDVSGVHHMWVKWCNCPNFHQEQENHLLQLGLFLVSYENIKATFTFKVLDDVQLSNLECKSSTDQYYQKLQCMTSPLFPNAMEDQYRELLRASWLWQMLKHLNTGGSSAAAMHGVTDIPTFCAACPQPGVNLPENWTEDPVQMAYTQTFVMDGNFTAVHQKCKNAHHDIKLSHGDFFMTKLNHYKSHLAIAKEHHAVNDHFIKYKGLDVTGVGATACGHHGCFCPSAVVDFQKGEQQANMDYSLSEALKNTNITRLKKIILIYDIMCQYWKRLRLWMEESQYIQLPLGIAILHGIGLFHVGGHVWQCFSCFSPSFIPSTGQMDGEILESLWSVLNEMSPSTQNATISGWIETLDDHMGDSNFKKMQDIGEY
ncbi:hypothetical protein L208DRAFT_1199772, partial [Tricholoma matsutake]